MEPLRIRAHMQDGRVAGGDPALPLDSILAYATVLLDHGDAYFNDLRDQTAIHPDLPLERRGQGEDWYWACSENQAAPLAEYTTHWHKRFDDEKIVYLTSAGPQKIPVGSGPYRAYRMPIAVQVFPFLEWFAVGDPEGIRRLCVVLTHLGKKAAQGFGPVERWEVTPWAEDWSCWREGRPTRPIPLSDVPAGTPMSGLTVGRHGIRPPYWHSPAWRPACWARRVDKMPIGIYDTAGGRARHA